MEDTSGNPGNAMDFLHNDIEADSELEIAPALPLLAFMLLLPESYYPSFQQSGIPLLTL